MSDYGNKLDKSVERCAALALERDQQAAYCAFLESAMKEVLGKFADSESLNHYLNIINSTPAQSLLIHDAEVLRQAGKDYQQYRCDGGALAPGSWLNRYADQLGKGDV